MTPVSLHATLKRLRWRDAAWLWYIVLVGV